MTHPELPALLAALRNMTVHRSSALGPARKKPLLVLLLATRLQQKPSHPRRFTFEEVREDLSDLIVRFGGRKVAAAHAEQPFYHLGSEPFWTCKLVTASPGKRRTPRPSAIEYGELSDEAYAVLTHDESRTRVVDVLLSAWQPDERSRLRDALGFEGGDARPPAQPIQVP